MLASDATAIEPSQWKPRHRWAATNGEITLGQESRRMVGRKLTVCPGMRTIWRQVIPTDSRPGAWQIEDNVLHFSRELLAEVKPELMTQTKWDEACTALTNKSEDLRHIVTRLYALASTGTMTSCGICVSAWPNAKRGKGLDEKAPTFMLEIWRLGTDKADTAESSKAGTSRRQDSKGSISTGVKERKRYPGTALLYRRICASCLVSELDGMTLDNYP